MPSPPVLQEDRIVISHRPGTDVIFLNVRTDDQEHTHCHRADARIPLQEADGTMYFGDSALLLDEMPQVGTEIVCTAFRGERARFSAIAWTPKAMWDAAKKTYIVVRVENGEETEHQLTPGIMDISRRFPSDLWRPDGTIYDNGTLRYYVLRVYTDSKKKELEVVPSADPRIPLAWMDDTHRHHSVLPKS